MFGHPVPATAAWGPKARIAGATISGKPRLTQTGSPSGYRRKRMMSRRQSHAMVRTTREGGQQHAEDEEGFAARDRRDQPVEVHPEKAGERGYGQEDQGHKSQAIDLLALFAGDLGGEVVE